MIAGVRLEGFVGAFFWVFGPKAGSKLSAQYLNRGHGCQSRRCNMLHSEYLWYTLQYSCPIRSACTVSCSHSCAYLVDNQVE